ncbi:MAG TPA: DUF2141 domain-containing protein [Candidatus Binataceae bacterium]|nr:DUF2141 domain-containing protein [Candidatus Binataceae bacterium]
MKRILLALLAIAACIAIPVLAQDAPSGGAPIIVKVVGFPDRRGRCACALYNKVQGFPRDRESVYRNAQAQIGSDNTATCEFKNIPTGTYAIALFHDAKMTGKMAKNLIGIPQEGYGFSNDCKPHALSAPTFQECAFQHDASRPTNLTLTLQHY